MNTICAAIYGCGFFFAWIVAVELWIEDHDLKGFVGVVRGLIFCALIAIGWPLWFLIISLVVTRNRIIKSVL